MSNTNSFSGIVKILETPRCYILNQKARLTKARVELPQKRKNKKNGNDRLKKSKRLFITVAKIYPILLNTDRSLTKISK